jgi:hypothetical protein
LENDVKVFNKNLYTGKVYSIIIFVGVLKVSDENRRIRIWIHQLQTWIRGAGSGSTPNCHGSGTLVLS